MKLERTVSLKNGSKTGANMETPFMLKNLALQLARKEMLTSREMPTLREMLMLREMSMLREMQRQQVGVVNVKPTVWGKLKTSKLDFLLRRTHTLFAYQHGLRDHGRWIHMYITKDAVHVSS